MKLQIIGAGPLAEQARRLADAAGMEIVEQGAALVLPATEKEELLASLSAGPGVLFDPAAWAVTSSRLRSDELLRARGIPVPAYFPYGSEPYLVKPDRGSFGLGIWVTDDYCEVGGAVNAGFVAQEALSGEVWSSVVTGRPGAYRVHAPVRLTFDDRRCRTEAVLAPAPAAGELSDTSVACAEALGVRGILEVEAILHDGVWRVTDLNARLPMLSPDALLASGDNLLTEMVRAFEG